MVNSYDPIKFELFFFSQIGGIQILVRNAGQYHWTISFLQINLTNLNLQVHAYVDWCLKWRKEIGAVEDNQTYIKQYIVECKIHLMTWWHIIDVQIKLSFNHFHQETYISLFIKELLSQ